SREAFESGRASPRQGFYDRTSQLERKSFSGMHCSVAQCLEAVGEWWSLLIVRDAFLGVTRFDEFQQRLGISRGVLNQRLGRVLPRRGPGEGVVNGPPPPEGSSLGPQGSEHLA